MRKFNYSGRYVHFFLFPRMGTLLSIPYPFTDVVLDVVGGIMAHFRRISRVAADLPSDNQDHEVEPNLEDVPHTLDCSLGGGSGDIWPKCVAGVKSEDHSGRARRGRNLGQRGRRQEMRRGPATDPGVGGDRGSFPFQLDDGRLPAGASGGGLLGDPSINSPLDWMSGGGAVGMDDPEGVHKRSLNGTSKGIPPTATAMAAVPSPRDDGDLIRRVVCDDTPGVMQQQPIQVLCSATLCCPTAAACMNELKLLRV